MATTSELEALDRGDASVELTDAHVTRIVGGDARGWLQDLVTTDVDPLRAGEARPSLLLTPTGRIRAQFQVACLADDAFALIQREPFAAPVASTLAPYVLSSDVELASTSLCVIAVPGVDTAAPRVATAAVIVAPSILGGGCDLMVERENVATVRKELTAAGLESVTHDAGEARRIRRGEPRFGFELDAESMPAEAGLDRPPVTDRTKGCFLGQESIAKIANLGHPTRAVLRIRSERVLEAGEPLIAAGETVGAVTSADGALGLARVVWKARDLPLETSAGSRVEPLAAV
jgi:folate-binding protein YgfZ